MQETMLAHTFMWLSRSILPCFEVDSPVYLISTFISFSTFTQYVSMTTIGRRHCVYTLQMTLMPGYRLQTARHFSINRRNFHETDICQLPFCALTEIACVVCIVSCRIVFFIVVHRSCRVRLLLNVSVSWHSWCALCCAVVEQMNILR